MGGPCQGEPHRIGQQRASGRGRHAERQYRISDVASQSLRPGECGDDEHCHHPERAEHEHHDQHLGPDEELEGDQEPEHDPGCDRTCPLAEEHLVETGRDERRHEGHPEHQVGIGEADQHERREPVEQPAHERGGCETHPPPKKDEHGEPREGGREGERDVQGHDRSEEPRHRSEKETEDGHAGVGEQVHPVRVAHRGGEEGVEAVCERGGRPGEEPGEQRAVPATTGGRRCRVGGPDVRPECDRQPEIAARGQQGRTVPGTPRDADRSRRTECRRNARARVGQLASRGGRGAGRGHRVSRAGPRGEDCSGRRSR